MKFKSIKLNLITLILIFMKQNNLINHILTCDNITVDTLDKFSVDDFKQKDENSRTALHAACYKACISCSQKQSLIYSNILKYMLDLLKNEAREQSNVKDVYGRTAAHYACGSSW